MDVSQSGKRGSGWRELEKKILWEFDKQIQIKISTCRLTVILKLSRAYFSKTVKTTSCVLRKKRNLKGTWKIVVCPESLEKNWVHRIVVRVEE